jgi:CheY-like chemotaxis protein/HPt (histidine-containing phosphotransfer) domain-containing protein
MKSPSLPPLPANVLLAEDDRDNRVIISAWLRRMGANVDVAENGRVAVETALAALSEQAPYDLVLMDMQMPELDGYGATFQLRSCGYRGLVVAFTAHAMDRDEAVCLSLGCDDYLSKPIDRARLRAVVERSLAAREPAAGEPRANGNSAEAEEDLESVTAEFAAMLPERARTIAEAIATNDNARASHLLHQLRGSAGSYGFASVSDAASDVESAISGSAAEQDVRAAVGELLSACRLVAA